MRKLLLLAAMCALMLALGGSLFAQEAALQEAPPQEAALREAAAASAGQFQLWKEYPWSIGGSYELGRNARAKAASGFGIGLDRFLFTPYVSLGLRGVMYNDGNTLSATEAHLNLRGYIPLPENSFVTAALFAQWGFGYSFYREEGRKNNTFSLDFIAGGRIYIDERPLRGFYLEPFIRAGFPLLISGGIAIGHWFSM